MLKFIPFIPLFILLTGCASPPKAVVQTEADRQPPAAAMAECEPLEGAKDGTLAEVYRAATAAGHKYRDCAARHSELSDWVKRGDR